MKNKTNNKKRQFTLIELIIVIVVIGILAGMALPKFIGVQRDAHVAAMFQDVDTLETSIMLYYQDKDELPVYDLTENTFNAAQTLLDTLNKKGDDVSKLKVIDKTKLKNYLGKDTKYGQNKTDDDEYLYSELTGNVYYSEGKKNGDNVTYHTYDTANGDPIYVDEDGKSVIELKDVKFGNTLLATNSNTIDEEAANNLTGLITKGKELKIEVNGTDLSTQIKKEEVAPSALSTKAKATETEYEKFILPATLDKKIVNKVRIKIPEENKTILFLIAFKGELEAPDVDIDTSKNPYELIVKYPADADVVETQYIVDNKEVTTVKPDLQPLMDKETHTINVRYKTRDNKISQWANVSFSYIEVTETPEDGQVPLASEFNWVNIISKEGQNIGSYDTCLLKDKTTGNYSIAYTSTIDAERSVSVAKYSSLGKSLGTLQLEKSNGISIEHVIQTKDGGYCLTGLIKPTNVNFGSRLNPSSNTEQVVVRYNASGKITWYNRYDVGQISSLIETNDGGIAFVGSAYDTTTSFTSAGEEVDGLFVKLNSSGTKVFSKVIGGGKISCNIGSVLETKDGGYLTLGRLNALVSNSTRSTSGSPFTFKSTLTGNNDLLITKYDSSGNVTWHKFYGSKTTGVNTDVSANAVEVSDGYIINTYIEDKTCGGDFGGSGSTVSPGYDKLILKVSTTGVVSWYNRYSLDSGELAEDTLLNIASNGNIVTSDNLGVYELSSTNGSVLKKFGYTKSDTNNATISNVLYDNGKYIVHGSYSKKEQFPEVSNHSIFIGDLKFSEFAK